MSKNKLERFKKNYQAGFLTYEMIKEMLNAGKITQEEFEYIVGEEKK